MQEELEKIQLLHQLRREEIANFLERTKSKNKDYRLGELFFCICTPQSKAKYAREFIDRLKKEDRLWKVTLDELRNDYLKNIRFNERKAEYIIKVRGMFPDINIRLDTLPKNQLREWLYENVLGFGLKESAHFMRNVGIHDVGIIDVHVQNFLKKMGMFDGEVGKISKKSYAELEGKFFELSHLAGIPPPELDIIIWLHQSGEEEFYG